MTSDPAAPNPTPRSAGAKRISTPVDFKLHPVIVVVPAYNEERFIGSVVLKIKRFPVEVIVVDDGSTDQTADLAEAAGAIVVRQSVNQGKGAALNAGIQSARMFNPEAIAVLDADGQHQPEELPRLVRPIIEGRADIVIGSRYMRRTSNTPLVRRLGHRLISLATTLPTGVSVTDSQSGFRAFSRRAYTSGLFQSTGFAVESEMQFIAHEHDLNVLEVPVTIRYTDPPKRSAISQGLTVLGGILRLVGQYRPLLFFTFPGFILLFVGLFFGLYVVQRFEQTGQLATGFAMVTILLIVIGVVFMSTGFTLHSVRGLLRDYLDQQQKERR